MSNGITNKELDEIEQRVAGTTPGPWRAYIEGRDHTSGSNFIRTGSANARGPDIELVGATVEDIDFVANARQDVLRLIAEIRRLRHPG